MELKNRLATTTTKETKTLLKKKPQEGDPVVYIHEIVDMGILRDKGRGVIEQVFPCQAGFQHPIDGDGNQYAY
jgi:hypothetical protein